MYKSISLNQSSFDLLSSKLSCKFTYIFAVHYNADGLLVAQDTIINGAVFAYPLSSHSYAVH